MNWLRVLLVGGLTSYRALFNWISPWIFFPHMIGFPVFETLFFAYLGRYAGVQSDTFFLIGNAFVAIAVTGMFGMSAAISGERRQQTLSALLASPASRIALFLGRALPSIVTGVVVAVASAAICAVILGVSIESGRIPALVAVALAASFSCTALGLWLGAFGLRGRNMTVFADSIAGLMLIVTGANVPLASLPPWVQEISSYVPLTHAIEAARDIAGGESLADVAGLVRTELAIGLVFLLVGLGLLRLFEYEGRRSATLEVF